MPEIQENLDKMRWEQIRHDALLIANLWLAVALAGERGDKPSAWTACENIRRLNVTVFGLVKALGSPEATEP